MDILITSTINRPSAVSTSSPPRTSLPDSFNTLLAEYTDEATPPQTNATPAKSVILVGEIDSENRTVSELLMQHKELKGTTWDIINSEQNQNNDYTKIQPGTRIYYNPEEGLLTWSNRARESPSSNQQAASPTQFDQLLLKPSIQNSDKMGLGVIGENTPTVSHLLKSHPSLKSDTWNILASAVNRDKDFTSLPVGAEVQIDPVTREISWQSSGPLRYPNANPAGQPDVIVGSLAARAAAASLVPQVKQATAGGTDGLSSSSIAPEHSGPPADLSEAVKPYMGTPYKEMNCYELLVKGLQHMDIPYKGRDGLYSKLTRMALDKGMAANAYLTGEGIVEAAGSFVLSKKYPDIGDWKEEAATLIREIEPLLNSGQILSFSTENRGHTGIVSQQKNQWTFINSGRLDNSVDLNSLHRGVGEEVLQEEVRNWFKLAKRKGERLSVTLGQLEHDRIHTAYNMSESFANRI
jgi:hypothetical protein